MDEFPTLPTGVFLRLDEIVIPERLRPVDEAWVEVLAASMDDHGLEQPIVVRSTEKGYRLVAGAHRIAGARRLEWPDICCIIREMTDEEARLVEIDENLMRRELNALDRGVFLLERKTVYERMNPQLKNGGDRKTIRSQTLRSEIGLDGQRFTKDVADKVGMSERTVQLAIQMASRLDPEAVASIRGTSFANNQNALLKLSNETPAAQRTLAATMRDGGAKTLDAARVAAGFQQPSIDNPQARHLATLLETWVKADAATRAAFLKDIGAAQGKSAR